MDNLIFEKGENSKVISLEDLSRTLTAEDFGKSKKVVNHFDIIPQIEEMLKEAGLKLSDKEIIISKAGLKILPKLDPNKESLIDAALVKNLVASFNIADYNNDEMNMRIGLSYNERGIAVAFGTNIKVCSNMTIMGAKNMIYSYGPKKVPFDKMIELIEKNIQEMDQSWKYYNEVFEKLKGKIATSQDLYTIIGKLQKLAVANNYINGVNSSPLNISETSSFTKELLLAGAFENEINTLWDIFNVGTEILTHSDMNIPNKWQSLADFGDFILTETDMSETPIVELN